MCMKENLKRIQGSLDRLDPRAMRFDAIIGRARKYQYTESESTTVTTDRFYTIDQTTSSW